MVQIGTNSKKPLGDAPLAQVSKGEDGKKNVQKRKGRKDTSTRKIKWMQ